MVLIISTTKLLAAELSVGDYNSNRWTSKSAKDFPVREDVMIDYYAAAIEMLLEKCFFT